MASFSHVPAKGVRRLEVIVGHEAIKRDLGHFRAVLNWDHDAKNNDRP